MKCSIVRIFTAAVMTLGLGMAPTAKAYDNKGCSNATLQGTFADKDTGSITDPSMAGPFAGVWTQTYDGNGGVTATGMVSLNGNIMSVTSKGTYTVNSDCTGTYTVQISPIGLTAHAFFVIDDGGNELQILVTDPGLAVTCIARKLYPGRNI
jgi:hypothetical protein